MANFTQVEINQLISCPKEITEAPGRMRPEGAQMRRDARLVATDGTKGSFSIFVRENIDFPENFSVGLTYSPNDGRPDITLLRCNGKHGVFNAGKNGFTSDHTHWAFHIHRASEIALDAGESAEKYAVITGEYASLEEAVQYFVREIGLSPGDASRHFPNKTQTEFEFNADPIGSA